MGYINKKSTGAKGFRKDAHLNFMGGPSYDIKNPLFKLRLAASSCFFGEPMYYLEDKDSKKTQDRTSSLNDSIQHELAATLEAIDPQEWRTLSPAKLMEKAIDEAIAFNPEGTLNLAQDLRNVEHIRVTPQVIMVRFANHPSIKGQGKYGEIFRKYAPLILKRGDEPAIQLAYQISAFGRKSIPNALKKAWRVYLEKANEYTLTKYRMENRQVKTVDVMNLVHPKSPLIAKLAKGELKLSETTETWESLISREGSSKTTWQKAIDVMGHMALLRNLRNLIENGVDPQLFMDKLLAGVAEGQQLPFRYYSAYKAITSSACVTPSLIDKLEECLIKSFENAPKFKGKVMSLCDNSGSARGTFTSSMGTVQVSDIANLTAVFTGYLADDGYVGIFGDELKTFPVRKRSSVFEQIKRADLIGTTVGGSTENGIWLFWDQAIKNKEHWDSVFIYSDMQAGHGGLYGTNQRDYSNYLWRYSQYIDVPKLIQTYRTTVNPDVKVYCVQVAGYQDTIVPEFYNKTFILGGWGEGIFRFAEEMENLFTSNKSEKIEKAPSQNPTNQ